jgi:Xaa-Pro aminopeptidase
MTSLEQLEKRARISRLLFNLNLDAVVLRKGSNIAWITCGRSHIPTTIELACMDIIVYRDRIVVVTNKIEAPRLEAEELTGDEELVVINWYESREAQLPKGPRIGTDVPERDRINISSEIELLRRNLNEFEKKRLMEIGKDASEALTKSMLDLTGDMTEVRAAGEIAKNLWERNLEPVVLLVAGENRIGKFRHPLPTLEIVGNTAMGVICARRKGLIASITRIINFGKVSDEISETYYRLLKVEGAFLDSTKPGISFGKVFKAGKLAYSEQGFADDEWTKHHQGGPTGYLPRDFPAFEEVVQSIAPNNAIAWNPSARGVKVEDTIITTEKGFDFVTHDPNWPAQINVGGRIRPGIAQR